MAISSDACFSASASVQRRNILRSPGACISRFAAAVTKGVPQKGQPLYLVKSNTPSGMKCPQGSVTPRPCNSGAKLARAVIK